jgi:hypothetical protein
MNGNRHDLAGAAMRRRPLNPEDRKIYDRWAVAVAAFYSVLTISLFFFILHHVRTPAVDDASSPAGTTVSSRSPGTAHQ